MNLTVLLYFFEKFKMTNLYYLYVLAILNDVSSLPTESYIFVLLSFLTSPTGIFNIKPMQLAAKYFKHTTI